MMLRPGRRLTLTLPLLLLGAPLATAQEPAAAGLDAPPEKGVIATVNGESVYYEDLERLLKDMHSGISEARRQAPDVERMMFRLVNDKLLAQEARSLGMQNDAPIPERMAGRRESLAVARLQQEEIWTGATPTEDELREAFEKEYRTITFRMLTTHERAEAETLRQQLRDQADFEELVKEHSVDQYSARGGLVENVSRIDVPRELADEAFAMEPGTITGPLRTRLGWASLRVESIADADPERYDGLKASLWELVRYRKAEVLRSDLGARLREAHPVVVDRDVADAVVAERLSDARLMPVVADRDAVVARIGERTITAGAYGDALKSRWKGVRNEEAALAARPIVLESLIRTELTAAEALARGYGDTSTAKRALEAYETQILVPRFLNEVVAVGLEVTREEMEAYYERSKEHLHRPPRVHLGQITVATEVEAQRLAELLRQGADMAWLARQHSTDRFKDAGGDRGWLVPKRSGDAMEEALFEARPGDIFGPQETGEGFVIVRVDASEDQGVYDLEEVSGNVRKAVYDIEFQRALHEYVQKLRSRSDITIHDDVLATMQITGSPTEEKGHGGDAPAGHGH